MNLTANIQTLKHHHLGDGGCLEAPRLILRAFVAEDWMSYYAYHQLADVYRYLYEYPPQDEVLEQQFDAACRPSFKAENDLCTLAVTRKSDNQVIGEVVLRYASARARQGEIRYIFNPVFSGHGYATEATAEVLTHGFHDLGLHRICARLDPANAGAVGVVGRLGMRKEAHLRQSDCRNGAWGDEVIYAVLRSEWGKWLDTSLINP